MGQSPACPAVSSRDPAPRPASTAARGPGAPSAPGPSQGVVVRLPLHALDAVPAGPRSRGVRCIRAGQAYAQSAGPCSRGVRARTAARVHRHPPVDLRGGSKRWPARIFHPRLRTHPVPKWRNGAIPRACGSRRALGSHAPATFLSPADALRAVTAGLPEAPTVLRASSTVSTLRSGWPLARIPAGAAAPGRLLRLFSSATPLRPPLYEKKGRSGGRKSEVKGKGRSRHGSAGRVPTYVIIS